MKLSIVIPVYNEEGNISNVHKEIKNTCESHNYTYEIIFVDDGSTDNTAVICKTLHPVKLIRFRKNFGQTAAMDAGIKAAKGDLIITMDGDGQNDPADIPRMIQYLEEKNLDVVSGWRKNRKDKPMKRFTSRGANFLRHILIHDGIHDSGCSLKVYKAECFHGVNLYGEQHRFIPALLKIRGFKIGEIVVNHRPRTSGKTKYNWKRTVKGFVDMISVWFWDKFASRPLHLLGGTGMCFIGLGFICGIWSLVLWLQGRKMSNNIFPPLLTVFFIVIGVLLFVFGLMSEIMIKTYYGVHVDTPYNIAEVVENREEDNSNHKETELVENPGIEL